MTCHGFMYINICIFIYMQQGVGGEWSESDVSRLYTAFLEHGANWPEVAAQVQ